MTGCTGPCIHRMLCLGWISVYIFLRKLYTFGVYSWLVSMFYSVVVKSIMSFCVIAWGGNSVCKDASRFYRVASRVSRMTDKKQSCCIEVLLKKCCVRKLEAMMKEANHSLHQIISFSKKKQYNNYYKNKQRTIQIFLFIIHCALSCKEF